MTYPKCAADDCENLLRPWHTTIAEHPGTKSRGSKDQCQACKSREYRKQLAEPAPITPEEMADIKFSRYALNAWLNNLPSRKRVAA